MADLLKAIKDIEPITVAFIVKKHLVMENTLWPLGYAIFATRIIKPYNDGKKIPIHIFTYIGTP